MSNTMTEPEPIKRLKLKDYLKELAGRLDETQNDNKQLKEDIKELKQYNAVLKAERDKRNENSTAESELDDDDWDLEDL